MNELALFAGAGGSILAGKLLGWRTVCAVEIDTYARNVLLARQRDGILEPFPVWDDVCTFDGKQWRGHVDVITAGFPCQDISAAGAGAGITGERSGLWKEMARIICEVRPGYVFVENSPLLADRGLGVVLGDLAEMGFDAEWGVYGSIDAELPALRERLWIVARAFGFRLEGKGMRKETGKELERQRFQAPKKASDVLRGFLQRFDASGLFGDADGMAGWVERLKATGNGQVPAVAARAFTELAARFR